MKYREKAKVQSNNENNPNKNHCGLAVARYLGVDETVRYIHNMDDIVRAGRNKWTVRSRASKVKGQTVGGSREKLKKMAEEMDCHVAGFVIRTRKVSGESMGHALFVDRYGETKVDTNPRQVDRRKITHCYIVYAQN